jgi:predicted nucleic acid-binding protein
VRVALDTNIMAYAEGIDDARMQAAATELVLTLPRDSVILPVQTLGELFNVLVRKGRRSRNAARDAVIKWRDGFPIIESSAPIMLAAADLATDHQLTIWDSVILSAAAHSGCRLLLSEDLRDGFTWQGVTAINPFASSRHPLLQALVAGSPQ